MQSKGVVDEMNVAGLVAVGEMLAVPGEEDVAAVEGGEGPCLDGTMCGDRYFIS